MNMRLGISYCGCVSPPALRQKSIDMPFRRTERDGRMLLSQEAVRTSSMFKPETITKGYLLQGGIVDIWLLSQRGPGDDLF